MDDGQYAIFVRSCARILSSKWTFILIVISSIVITASSVFATSEYCPTPWSFALTWHFYLLWLPRTFLANYLFIFSTVLSIFGVIFLIIVFQRFTACVIPYHEDKAGGLKPIGSFALGTSRLVLILTVFVISEVMIATSIGKGVLGQYNVIGEIIGLPLLIIIVFFSPIYTCHRSIESVKRIELGKLSKMIHSSLSAVNSKGSKDQIGEINELITLRNKIDKEFPTYPFNVGIIQRFVINLFITLIPTLLGSAADLKKILV